MSKSSIPEHAHLVFKGKIFDVYQWPQEMYDGTTHTFEMLKRADTAVIIPITENGDILVTEEEQPNKPLFLSVPGGRIEENETPEDGAKRELLEETGYTCEELILWETVKPASKIDWTIYTYIAKKCRKVTEPKLDSGEKVTTKLITFDQFVDYCLHENFTETAVTLKVMKAKLDPLKMEELKKDFLG